MFDTYYPFRFVMRKDGEGDDLFLEEIKYTFTDQNNHRYIINLERYEYDLYAVKFHLKAHSDSEHKYRLLTGFQDAAKVISTSVHLIRQLTKDDPTASFGFIGSRRLEESIEETKRFKVYRRIMENLFSLIEFYHYTFPERSAYLLLRRSQLNKGMLEYIEDLFDQYMLKTD